MGGLQREPEGEVPAESGGDIEAPEGKQSEGEEGAAGQRMGAGPGGTGPPEDIVPEEAEEVIKPRGEEEPVPGPRGLAQRRRPAAPRENTRSPSPDGEGDSWMEPEPRGPQTKRAQWRALLADSLLRRGALFRHIWQLSLPSRGSKRAATDEAEGELAEKKGKEP